MNRGVLGLPPSLAGGSATAWVTGTTYKAGGGQVVSDGGYVWLDVVGGVSSTSPTTDGTSRWVRLGVLTGSGKELAGVTLATTLTGGTGITTTGTPSSTSDTTKDIDITGLACSPVIGTNPVYVEALVSFLTAATGTFQFHLIDVTAGAILDTVAVASTAFSGTTPRAFLKSRHAPAAGARAYKVAVAGTAGTHQINAADAKVSTYISCYER